MGLLWKEMATLVAKVTANGIVCGNQLYTCRRALKEGWFMAAWNGVQRTVHIKFMKKEDGHEQFYIVSSEPGDCSGEYWAEDDQCYPLEGIPEAQQTADREAIETYQQRFRQLREEWFNQTRIP